MPSLDDMAWHALTGPQVALAVTADGGAARRYRDGIAPFCGVERLDRGGWEALAELVDPADVAVFLRAEVGTPPRGWTELLARGGHPVRRGTAGGSAAVGER